MIDEYVNTKTDVRNTKQCPLTQNVCTLLPDLTSLVVLIYKYNEYNDRRQIQFCILKQCDTLI